MLLGELIDTAGQRRDLALKGSGRTPFSRRGDGKAALGPALREYLMGEAMHALGIPTTRALAVIRTGERVNREGSPPGAILVRVAASHLRVGTFEFFAAREEEVMLRRLLDYAVARHDPALAKLSDKPIPMLEAVCERQAQLIARWMGVGFIHGVMNTDNMSISGETIDYGPCAFMEGFDPATVFSSIDRQGRYAYGQQPAMAQWNLARLAEALLPVLDARDIDVVERVEQVVAGFAVRFDRHWTGQLRAKLGLAAEEPDDRALADDFLQLLQREKVDFTLAFRLLSDAITGPDAALHDLFGRERPALSDWLARWRQRMARGKDLAGLRRNGVVGQSLRDPAQSPGGGGAVECRGRGRPRSVRAPAGGAGAAVRDGGVRAAIHAAGLARSGRSPPHLLRHLIGVPNDF